MKPTNDTVLAHAIAEIVRLRQWVKEEGIRSNTCTFYVLGEVCENCQCSRRTLKPERIKIEQNQTNPEEGQSKLKHLVSLLTSDLAIYTVVVMARRDLQQGRFESAVARLRVDADKLRTHSKDLYDFIATN